MAKAFYDTMKLGILGGGQLGRMLLQKAADFNISNAVLDPDPDAPCRGIADEFVLGNFRDYHTVLQFGSQVDILTIEIEHVNVDALEELERDGVRVYPQPRIIRLVQDKGAQKIFYRTHGLPTAEFHLIDSSEHIEKYSSNFPVFQKLRREGYDGRGVQRIENTSQLNVAFNEPSVLEKVIDFEKEISVIVARNAKGDFSSFPVVDMEFNAEANLVEYLYAPSRLPPEKEREAVSIARQLAECLQLVGLLAVEMFLTRDGNLLINEIAPRPHNSGHHTIEANVCSQYEQHLRAILNLPLGSTKMLCPSVMVNLLGEQGYSGQAVYQGLEEVLAMDGVKIHLYGKKFTKPFRKMGHITIIDDTLESAWSKARKVKDILKVIS